jgi:hypothetical protein
MKKMRTSSFQLRAALAIAFITLATMLSATSVKAQTAGSPVTADSTRTAEGRAAALTEKMKTELSLTADQYPSVQALNLKYAQKNEQIFKGSDGKFAKYKALKASQKDKNKEMKAILTSDQYKKYEEMVKQMTEELKRRRT